MRLDRAQREALRKLLLTTDGKGVAVKEAALDKLLDDAFERGADAERVVYTEYPSNGG